MHTAGSFGKTMGGNSMGPASGHVDNPNPNINLYPTNWTALNPLWTDYL